MLSLPELIVFIVIMGTLSRILGKKKKGTKVEAKTRLDGRTAVVTGANGGIGAEAARELARRGARVAMACRDVKRANLVAEQIREETGASIAVSHIFFLIKCS